MVSQLVTNTLSSAYHISFAESNRLEGMNMMQVRVVKASQGGLSKSCITLYYLNLTYDSTILSMGH